YGGTRAIVLLPRSLVGPGGVWAKDTAPLPVAAGSSAQIRARHAIASGQEPAGPGEGRSSLPGPGEQDPSPPVPSVPAAASSLRAEWGPPIAWPETSPANPASPPSPAGSPYTDRPPRAPPRAAPPPPPRRRAPPPPPGGGPAPPPGAPRRGPGGAPGRGGGGGARPRPPPRPVGPPPPRPPPPPPPPAADFGMLPEP